MRDPLLDDWDRLGRAGIEFGELGSSLENWDRVFDIWDRLWMNVAPGVIWELIIWSESEKQNRKKYRRDE